MAELEAPTTRPTQKTLPNGIESTGGKLVYLYLDAAGPTTISDLADALDMRKLSLYSVLDALAGKDIVAVDGETYGLAS